MVLIEQKVISRQENDSLTLKGFDYVELYVGNASHAAHFYRTAFGFRPVAYTSLETGNRDRVSYVMEQGNIRLILTAAVTPDSLVAEHVRKHGDSVKDIAFTVDNAANVFEAAISRGAQPVMEPTVFESETGLLKKATIRSFGNTVHSFIERDGTPPALGFPEYRQVPKQLGATSVGLTEIDHIAICVEEGKLDEWIDFYRNVLSFHQSHQEDIATNLSAMNSKVVQNKGGEIKFPIMEPARGRRKSQIEEYLAFNQGAGSQHVAFLSANIVESVSALRDNAIEFLPTPNTYYQMLAARVGEICEDIASLQETNILVDRDEWGYLLQVFTRPLQSRPTLFGEIIQREGARGFGGGNIKALFEALEREQELRGNL